VKGKRRKAKGLGAAMFQGPKPGTRNLTTEQNLSGTKILERGSVREYFILQILLLIIGSVSKQRHFTMESLILAQDER
jgi:hypothetical protein